MSGIHQANFDGHQQQDGVNNNTSRVMIPQVVGAQPRTLESNVSFAGTPTSLTQATFHPSPKEIFYKFVSYMLELSNKKQKPVDGSILTLIQELVDAMIEPEQFCDQLEELLNVKPQPYFIVFLKNNLPLMRQSLMSKEIVIDVIQPPRH